MDRSSVQYARRTCRNSRGLLICGSVTLIVFLFSMFSLYAQHHPSVVDGSKREQYAVAEDDLYKSPIQLAVSGDGRRLYVVCENTDEVLVVDTAGGTVIGSVRVGGRPFGIALSPDERRIYVSNRWDDNVTAVDVESREIIEVFPVGDDPHDLVTDDSGKYLYVTNLASNDVSVVETETFTEVKRLQAGTSPFGLALSPDGRYIYVSNQLSNPVAHRTPPCLELTVIDAHQMLVVGRRIMHSTVIGQGLAVAPDNRFVFVALELPKNLIPETQIFQGWMVTHGFAVAEQGPRGRIAYLLLDEPHLYYADPFGLTFSPDGKRLFVSSSGANVVSVVDVQKVYDLLEVSGGKIGVGDETIRFYSRHLALSSEYVVARIPTGSNPKGMAISPDGRWVYAANRLSDCIAVVDAHRYEIVDMIDLGGPDITTILRKGEKLFNYASISFQKQLSCNTCHPENHLDGLIYDIAIDGGMGRNLVDNRTMRGISETQPFKWSGKNPTLYRQEGPRAAQLFFRSHGFEKDDNEAIVKFIESLPLPWNRFLSPGENLNEFQKRGKEMFERAYTNDGRYIPISNRCITCHPPTYYTDRSKHDVGTQAYYDTEGEFDTPQLNNILENAPFLHDGRCYSLEEIWTKFNPDDLHGVTNDMKKEQLNDLIEYTKALLPLVPPAVGDMLMAGSGSGSQEDNASNPDSQEPAEIGYVGNQVCKGCHAGAYRIWVASKHARAFVSLQTRMAMMMGEECKIEASSPTKSIMCRKCHATAADVPGENRAPGFHIEEGVKCEACHGPGSGYCREEIMRDMKAAKSRGLLMPTEDDCMKCHKHKPSHEALKRKPFDYTESWKKIAHSKK